MDTLLTPKEIGARLGVSEVTIFRLYDSGALNGVVVRAGKRKRWSNSSRRVKSDLDERRCGRWRVEGSDTLPLRFRALLETHVPRLKVTGTKATGHVPWREDKHPSFSADLAKGVWFDHGRGEGGGVKRFAELVGDPWGTTRLSTCDRARFAGQVRRREAEAKARAILTRRKDEREDTLWAAWGKANTTATDTAELLALFFRHPDLVEELLALVETTETEYSDALWRKMLLEQQFAGEVGR